MTSVPEPRCKKKDCEVAATGKCAEGHDPVRSCPNFANAEERGEDEYEGHELPGGHPGGAAQIMLPPGELLSLEDVQRFLLWRPATFISVVGDSFSGKTTLMCALYDRFLRGPFAGVSFSASRTLVALERRMHPSRVDSGRAIPDTVRTSIADGLRYFHFAVAPLSSPHMRTDLLLSDRAGETYRKARSNTDIVADLPEISQADRIVLLLDGGRVADPVERAGAIQGARQMLRVLLDNGAAGAASVVQVVTTKIDLLDRAEDKQIAAEVLASFRERLLADFGPKVQELTFWEVAARDPEGTYDPAYGLGALVEDWVKPRRHHPPVPLPPLDLKSEFDRLLARTPLERAS